MKKSLSTRTHTCQCGCVLDRDANAALNILTKAIGTVGHTGTSVLADALRSGKPIMEAHQADAGIASGDLSSTFVGANLRGQDKSLREESPARVVSR